MPQELKTSFFTVLFIFLGLLLYTKFFGAIPFSVNSVTTTKSNLFQVSGTGKATAVPDTALISLGVTKTAATVTAAQDQTNTAVNTMINDLKKLGVEEKHIKTTNYSVNPNYDFTAGRQTVTGYTVTQNLEVRVMPIDKANQAIDSATKDGANQIGGITFILNKETQKKLEDQARKEAVTNAKEKAQSLSNAAGITLGRIIDVQESGTQPPVVFRSLEADQARGSAEPTQLTPGENTVTISISLSYETR